MNKICIIHYGEIGLKGHNRRFFENKLLTNIKYVTKDDHVKVKKQFGRLLIILSPKTNEKKLAKKLKMIFGIENFCFGYKTKQEIKQMATIANKLLKDAPDWKTFKIQTKRGNKNFPMKSEEINHEVGRICDKYFVNKDVKLKNPDQTIHIEIVNKDAYVLGNKLQGPGGLPVGASSPVLSLLSGGIDSPVASRLMMKRGCPTHFIHFHSYPFTNKEGIEKVKQLAKITSVPEQKAKLILVPIIDIQKSIVKNCDENYRVLLYRRFMLRIAQKFAKKIKIQALVTGESVGQVASQTIENIASVHEVIDIPVLQPLIGLDKKEIITIAKHICTFETSILPHEDCCMVFMPKNPALRASVKDLKKQEKRLKVNVLVKSSMKNAEILEI